MDTTVDRIAQINAIRNFPGDFSISICDQFDRNGVLSEKQWFCVENMIEQNNRPKITLDFAAMIELFTKAAAVLQFPKVRLQTTSGELVCLGRAGNRSKAPGTITVTDGGPFCENVYYGRIELDGKFAPTRKATEEIVSLLKRFSNDPAGVAAEYGKLTGNCCFCRHGLKDERSTEVGYGPVCAKNFGLPWG